MRSGGFQLNGSMMFFPNYSFFLPPASCNQLKFSYQSKQMKTQLWHCATQVTTAKAWEQTIK